MKRFLKIAGLVLVILLAIPVGLLAWTFAGNPEVQDGRELQGFARTVKDGYVSLFMLDAGPGKVALIDAGNDPAGKAILAELSRRKLEPAAVEAIFLTHGHADHVSACRVFPQATVYALEADVGLAEGRDRARGALTRWLPPQDRGARVTRPLKDGETIPVGDLSLRVFAVPGHTAGSAAYLVNGVLFLGDSADGTKEGRMTSAKFIFSDDPALNETSLHTLAGRLKPEAARVKELAFAHTGTLPGQALFDFATGGP